MTDNHTFIAFILGFVQGLSEFLPVSSSGHLILISWLFEGKPLSLTINIALHFGTLLSVLIYFRKDWAKLLTKSLARFFYRKRSFESDTLLPAILLGTLPAALLGISGKNLIESIFHHPLAVALPLFLVGFLLWMIDRKSPADRRLSSITIYEGLLVGFAQAFALIPGVSRSGATLCACRHLRFDRDSSAKFSFLLGAPAMAGAAILHLNDFLQVWNHPDFIVGVCTSFIVGCLTIKFFLHFIRRCGFLPFAIYRGFISLTILIFSLFFQG